MKKRFLSVLMSVVMLMGITACGGGNSQQPVSHETETTTEIVSKQSEIEHTGNLVVYSSHDQEPLNAGINMFKEKYPDINVQVVSEGTGELCARIAEEADAPKADVIWGGGADSLSAYKSYFAPYTCANDEFIAPEYKDPEGLWIGESPLPMVIIYNKDSIEKENLTVPQSWLDLTKPEWKGKIAYCQPSLSGSAYTQLCTMIFAHDWDFVKSFCDNLDGKILDSSEKCHSMVADGEFAAGLTFEKAAIMYKDDPNIGFVYPNDGTSAVPDGVALIKGCPDEENAKLFIDFVTSEECQKEQSTKWGRRPVRSDVEAGEGIAPLSDIVLTDYDFDMAANDKAKILGQFEEMTEK